MNLNNRFMKFTFIIILLGISIIFMIDVKPAFCADWSQWRGLNRNDISSESSGWPSSWPPEKIWSKNVGKGCASPIIADGRMYVMGWNGEGNFRKNPIGTDNVYCLDALTGKELWRKSYPSRYQSRVRNGDLQRYGGPSSTPTFDTKTQYLYTLSIDGEFRCWDTKQKGKLIWSKNLFDEYQILQRPDAGGGIRDYGFTSSPLIQDDIVMVEVGAKEGNIIAFDKKTGKQLWISSCNEPAGHTAGPVFLNLQEVSCIANLTLRKLVVMRIDNGHEGETIAEYPWQTDFANNISTPAIFKNQILVTSDYNVSKTSLIEISLKNGAKEKWNTRTHSKVSSPVIYKNCVFMADGPFKCLDLKTGKLNWRGKNFMHGSCLITSGDDKIIAFGKGNLALIEAFPSDNQYHELSRIEKVVPDVCYPHVILSDGIICCKDKAGNIVCFSL